MDACDKGPATGDGAIGRYRAARPAGHRGPGAVSGRAGPCRAGGGGVDGTAVFLRRPADARPCRPAP